MKKIFCSWMAMQEMMWFLGHWRKGRLGVWEQGVSPSQTQVKLEMVLNEENFTLKPQHL